MGGQVLGGGVIVLVAALLWLVYLLPSWASRRQYDAAERNAVRLNQALRVLAETSETPEEVHLELNARTALAQQKLARRALAEQEDLAKRTQAELEQARLEEARAALAVARDLPAARRARARRRARLLTTILALAALGLVSWGVWELVTVGVWSSIAWGAGVLAVCVMLLRRMARVGRRAAMAETVTDAATRAALPVQDVALAAEERAWEPRELPRPLTASAGSRAAAVLDVVDAREALREAAREEAMRVRAEAQRPPSIDRARRAREEAAASGFAPSGQVDDAEIEAHVRRLLERRASGQ
ncbi:large exoprotein [Microbacterium sp. 4R-513]|uniref:large exoprotein n=1 Tax=Microbacterium sp. 4R-513 TaxID=2567934 RepID=UPI0013E163AA|nr:large exoprotein [Microbacterium sp. 4R-513]QIG40087.1 large exoprotein [Microbacterium sp. 4R-513]